ncbi:hypothetical protein [Fictibacillus phosphorivorans]|uniref:hypothetical protein n=1 Tax=Fictibacillus phosphorivorans TaxID=1221500 RepID=UPI001293A702|nr:hypothetical protein [Fictibacillus phosphorivorans]MQR95931.1 hypothetical protein [Fictibacillus phosphorivorans]
MVKMPTVSKNHHLNQPKIRMLLQQTTLALANNCKKEAVSVHSEAVFSFLSKFQLFIGETILFSGGRDSITGVTKRFSGGHERFTGEKSKFSGERVIHIKTRTVKIFFFIHTHLNNLIFQLFMQVFSQIWTFPLVPVEI